MESTEDGPSQLAAELKSQSHPARNMEMAIEHDRISWGGGSAPSLPSIDDDPHSDAMSITDSVKSSTMSLDPTLYHFIEENGRTYHKYKQGRYFLPNDSAEQERLDLQHQLFCITIGSKLNLCPLPKTPKRVLDIATGTGIWAIEFASQYPDTEVIGTDLSPIQPHYLPENCRFEIDDAEDDWTYNEPFSFIHGRALMSCFDDPSRVVKQAYENLEPGGFIEFQDALFPMYWVGEPVKESALYRWNELLMEGVRRIGRSWSNVVNYPRYFEEAGFVNIVDRRFYWPTSPWAKGKYFKTVAMYFQEDMISGMEAISMKVLQATGMSPQEIKDFCEEVKRDFRDTNLHAYLTVSYIYAQKPLDNP
ncbi:S-adenosyl-L-methionine-dependent methyltransferase [Xylaria bambusicola]|uniref:S-adenosyl-L-methionine-dependent methyltransferase n=1 Tax=Xylaria bambusicola TaxID=326684 RepID=UPI002008C533|nr:S-adenosyl-L-methionine-dependent methyltransferase [Xylaria bambusicola]KAI0525519.1 S-adenosyl-L-methionine-dependent methyltransferase [Xylaria bambusicola]